MLTGKVSSTNLGDPTEADSSELDRRVRHRGDPAGEGSNPASGSWQFFQRTTLSVSEAEPESEEQLVRHSPSSHSLSASRTRGGFRVARDRSKEVLPAPSREGSGHAGVGSTPGEKGGSGAADLEGSTSKGGARGDAGVAAGVAPNDRMGVEPDPPGISGPTSPKLPRGDVGLANGMAPTNGQGGGPATT
jgi:hypothetical protein